MHAWCDVGGLRSRFPKNGRRSSVAAVHRQSSGLQQIVAAPDVKSTSTTESNFGRLEAALKVREEPPRGVGHARAWLATRGLIGR